MPPLVQTPKIVANDEWSSIKMDDVLATPELVLPISEVIETRTAQQVIQFTHITLINDKCKVITFE